MAREADDLVTTDDIPESGRSDFITIVALLILTGVVSWHRLWLQNGLAHLDISTFYLPWYAFMGEHLRNFDIPGWNPATFSGTAFAGDPQSGWMYLPAMLFFTLFDSVRAYEFYLIFHLALAGIATYAYARIIGLRPIAAITAAIAYEFGPFVNHISCCLIHVQLAVWIPVALLGVELTMRSASWTARAAAWTLTGFAVSQMVAGWVGQGVYNGLLVVSAYIAFRAFFTAVTGSLTFKQRMGRLFFDGAGSMIIGIGLSAAGFLPRLDVVNRTNLAGGEYSGHEINIYAAGWGPLTVLDRMFSDDNGFVSLTFYLGAPVIALILVALFLARSNFRAPFFVVLTVVTAIMTLHPTLFHYVIYALLPRYEVLHEHVPSRILAIQWIGPAMLSGIAVEMLFRQTSRLHLKRASIVAMAGAGFGFFILIAGHQGVGTTTMAFAVATALVILGFAHPTSKHGNAFTRSPRVLGLFLALLVFLDPAGRGLIDTVLTDQPNELLALPTGPVSRDAIPINASSTDEGGAGEFLQDLQASGGIFRYFGYNYALNESGNGYPSTYREYYWLPEAQDLLVNARAMSLGLNDIQGYNPMQFANYINAILFANHIEQNYHDSQVMPSGIDSPILTMLNTQYIIIPNKIPPGRPRPDIAHLLATHETVFRNDTIRVLKLEESLPRAWIVHDTVRATNNFGLMMIDSGLVDPAGLVFLDPGVKTPSLNPVIDPAIESVTVTHNGADQIRLQVSMAADGMVIVSQTYDPDWTAYVDGKKLELYQANGVIQGIAVPAGEHEIELVYEPVSLQFGIYISVCFSLLVLLILAAYGWTRYRNRRQDVTGVSKPV